MRDEKMSRDGGKNDRDNKNDRNDRKEKFIIFALAGILLLVVCIPVKKKEDGADASPSGIDNTASLKIEEAEEDAAAEGSDGTDAEAYKEAMERELEELLEYMDGAGRVKVMITLQSTGETVVEKDRPSSRSNMTENDGTGGSRNSNDMDSQEETVFVTDREGRQIPYVRKTMQPAVEGVAVLAEGGGSETVRNHISEAIQVLFGIDANKIKIAKMKPIK